MSAAREQVERRMTVAEFLLWDNGTDMRYELVNGVLVAMNPLTTRHADIGENIGRALERQLVPPCRVYRAAIGVAHGEEGRTWREPDLVVTCKRPGEGFIAEPRLIVEVLSPSTEKEDRTTKLDFYESFPSLEAILLVWQDERRVRLRSRGDDGWQDHDTIGSGVVEVPMFGIALSLDEIYADPWAEEG